MTKSTAPTSPRCVQCRRVASVRYKGAWYCRPCSDKLTGVSPKKKSAAKGGKRT